MQSTVERDAPANYDLIIVGGGLVGMSLAAALQETTLRVALVDARAPQCNDPRLLALNASSCALLKKLELWDLLNTQACPIHEVHVSSQGHFGAVRLNRDLLELPALGHVIPAYVIEKALQQRVMAATNIHCYQPASLLTLEQQSEEALLTIQAGEEVKLLRSGVIIAADGTHSTVRTQMGIEADCKPSHQMALVTRTTLSRSHGNKAYERFNDKGAIAMLPLVGEECATIWTADQETIARLIALSPEDFRGELQKEFGYRLGRLQCTQPRSTYPLTFLQAKQPIKGCVYLLGNAAHTVSPIAAQGLNLALYEVAVLIESLLEKQVSQTVYTINDIAKLIPLTQKQQAISVGISHRLSNLFSYPSTLMSMAWPLGTLTFSLLPPVRKRFMQRLLGRNDRTPRLLLGNEE